MHPTAMNNCKSFFECYAPAFANQAHVKIIEIGSQDVNGSLREIAPPRFEYIGVDFQDAKGVDVILEDPYKLPFEDNSADIFLSSSCFEHSEMFWLVFLEIMRVLKPGGLFYLNVPSVGNFHRYPVDCWRFYPDSAQALVNWAKRNRINAAMLESYTQFGSLWQDYVAVFLKDETLASKFPNRIIDTKQDFENGQVFQSTEIRNINLSTQHEKKLLGIQGILNETIKVI
ncbi:MAG: Chromosome segregation ATPases-like protein [Hyphomonadaceae bacterium]|nr:MAG: Chromosome segregation ATPases-like protein [Hyphomonadaceae bacterium]KAF0184713.1 MAG: Chromosome segregation ATPases-like protein [Hyphomonadaceae bacterium]